MRVSRCGEARAPPTFSSLALAVRGVKQPATTVTSIYVRLFCLVGRFPLFFLPRPGLLPLQGAAATVDAKWATEEKQRTPRDDG